MTFKLESSLNLETTQYNNAIDKAIAKFREFSDAISKLDSNIKLNADTTTYVKAIDKARTAINNLNKAQLTQVKFKLSVDNSQFNSVVKDVSSKLEKLTNYTKDKVANIKFTDGGIGTLNQKVTNLTSAFVSLTTKIERSDKALKSLIDNSKKINDISDKFKALSIHVDSTGTGFYRVNDAISKLANNSPKIAQGLSGLKIIHKDMSNVLEKSSALNKSLGNLNKNFNTLSTASPKLNTSSIDAMHKSSAHSLYDVVAKNIAPTQVIKTDDTTHNLRKGLRGVGEEADIATAKGKKLATQYNLLMQAGGFIFAQAVADAFGSAISKSNELYDELVKINRIGDFQPTVLANIKQDIKELRTELPLAYKDLSEIMVGAVKGRIPTQDLKAYTELIAKAAYAFEIDPRDASDSLAKITNVFDINIGKLNEYVNLVNKISDRMGGVYEKDVVEVTKRTAGIGKNFGLNEKDLGVIGASLLSSGMQPEIAATAINGLLGSLRNVQIQTPQFKRAFQAMGIDMVEFSKMVNENGSEALDFFLQKLADLDKETRSLAIGSTFARGADANALSNIADGLDKYRANKNVAKDVSGYDNNINEVTERGLKSVESQLKLTTGAFDNLVESITSGASPAIVEFSKSLQSLFKDLDVFVNGNQELVKLGIYVTGFTAALAGMAAIAPFVVSALSGITAGFTLLFATPVGLAITAISALVVGFLYFKDTTFEVNGQTVKLTEVIKALGKAFMVIAKPIMDLAIGVGRDLVEAFNYLTNKLANFSKDSGLNEIISDLKVFLGFLLDIGGIKATPKISLDISDEDRAMYKQMTGKTSTIGMQKEYVNGQLRSAEKTQVKLSNDEYRKKEIGKQYSKLTNDEFKARERGVAKLSNDDFKKMELDANYKNKVVPTSNTYGGKHIDASAFTEPTKKGSGGGKARALENAKLAEDLANLNDSYKIVKANFEIQKDIREAWRTRDELVISENLDSGLIGISEAFDKRIELIRKRADDEKKALSKEIKLIQDQIKAYEDERGRANLSTPEGVTKNKEISTKIAGLNADALTLKGKIDIIDINTGTNELKLSSDKDNALFELKSKISAELEIKNIDKELKKIQVNQSLVGGGFIDILLNEFSSTKAKQLELIEVEKKKIPIYEEQIKLLNERNRVIEENAKGDKDKLKENKQYQSNKSEIEDAEDSVNAIKLREFNLVNDVEGLKANIDSIKSSFQDMLSDIILNFDNAGDAVRNFAKALLKMAADIVAKNVSGSIGDIFKAINSKSSGGGFNIGSLFGGGGDGGFSSIASSAVSMGNFATGGYVNKFGIVHRGEGVIPSNIVEDIGIDKLNLINSGYTGDGGKYEVAGIVPQGSYVLNKEVTSKLGRGFIDRLIGGYNPFSSKLHKNSLKIAGFANGGLVGGSQAPSQQTTAMDSNKPKITINNYNANKTDVTVTEQERNNYIISVVDKNVKNGGVLANNNNKQKLY
jgi:TP901 family phage tail tape measure protein